MDLSFNPDPQALNQPVVCPVEQLFVFQLLLQVEGDSPAVLSFLAFLKPVCIRDKAPVV